MQIREMMKKFMSEHKNKIELLQWGIINGFTTIFYSAFIASFKQVYVPTRKIKVPPINSIKHILDKNNQFMKNISDNFIDKMKERLEKNWQPYLKNCPELEIFNDENIELLKTVFDLYIIDNICKRIPEAITNKFSIGDESQQMIIEDTTISYDLKEIYNDTESEIIKFIIDESLLQIITLFVSINKNLELPERNNYIKLSTDAIVTIDNKAALCPVLINKQIVSSYFHIMKIIEFVTSSYFEFKIDNTDYTWFIKTNPFNEVSVTTLGLPVLESEE